MEFATLAGPRDLIGNRGKTRGWKFMTQGNTAASGSKRPTLTLARSLVRPGAAKGISGRSVKVVTVRAVRPANPVKAAPPAKAPAPPAKPAKPAKPIWIRPLSQDAIVNRERSFQTHLELVRRFPACFMPRGEPMKPLAMGIDAQLFEACPDIDRHALMFFLGEYTSAADYHRAMIVEAARVDLGGAPAGVVTLSNAAYAKHKLKVSIAS
jgi:ProQ/FINO family